MHCVSGSQNPSSLKRLCVFEKGVATFKHVSLPINVCHSTSVSARIGANAIRLRTCLDLRNLKMRTYVGNVEQGDVVAFVAIELKQIWPRGTFNGLGHRLHLYRLHKKTGGIDWAASLGFHPRG